MNYEQPKENTGYFTLPTAHCPLPTIFYLQFTICNNTCSIHLLFFR